MGIFSNIIDGFSGKTYRYNTLISNNITKLLKHIENEDNLYKKWSTACILSINNFLEWVLFKGKDEEIFNIFRKNLDKALPENMFKVMQYLSLYHLFIFETANNIKELFYIEQENFENNIFRCFEIDEEEINEFNKLKSDAKSSLDSLPFNLYRSIAEKGFNIKEKRDARVLTSLFQIFKLNYQEVFMSTLNKEGSNA